MAKTRTNSPQNRGLVTAVALFSVAVLGGVYWIMQRGEELGTGPAALLPSLNLNSESGGGWSLRGAGTLGGPSTTSPPDQMLESYRRQGATVGAAHAFRGDVIQIGNQYFRLVHVDEATGYSHCGASRDEWPCGTTPQRALSMKISGKHVACFNRGYNVRNEPLGQCFLSGLDLGGWMVEQGMAFAAADRTDYRYKQNVAKRERRGYWSRQ